MSDLIENLSQFNRKERFHLLAEALGMQRMENQLDPLFASRLSKLTGLKVPPRVFLAIDYHLDWLYAALQITQVEKLASDVKWNPASPRENVFSRGPEGRRRIYRTPQDIDLLIAYDEPETKIVQLLLVEAKFDTSWSNSQLEKKARHLSRIFGSDENEWAEVAVPHFLIASPREPKNLKREILPAWARVHEPWWIKIGGLHADEKAGQSLVRICCCDKAGQDSRDGNCWKVVKVEI